MDYDDCLDSPNTTAKQISAPPIHPKNPKNSDANIMANIVAATGSNEKISAVSVGFKIF